MPDNYFDTKTRFYLDPPLAERSIELYGEQVTVGVWENEGSFGYALKKSNGYNPYEIHWLTSDLLDLINSVRD